MRPDHLENAAALNPEPPAPPAGQEPPAPPAGQEPPAPPAGQEPPAPNVYSAACPSRRLLALLSDKWSLLILPALKHGPMRNAQLLRAVDGVSQKMLTQTLRHLERCGLILRRDFGEVPPRVEYSLSSLGLSLAGVFAEIDGWVHEHFKEVQAAQDAFDRREGERDETASAG